MVEKIELTPFFTKFKLKFVELIAYEHGDRNSNKIALTFDDGPNDSWTLKVLDILDNFDVKANFFILGKWAEKYPNIVKETFRRGHLIGNHTYSHPNTGCGDFEKAEKIIFNIIGENTKFIRPPYNLVELCYCYNPAMKGEVKIINNEVIPQDWKKESDEIITSIEQKTQNGSIILLHDGSQREYELENRPAEMFKALPNILKNLKTKFEIVKLDELNFDI
jgi:peptidoglycan/xylan/chitin deacetylase (PgdA/CDA1 family)